MIDARPGVKASSYNDPVAEHHRSHGWIRTRSPGSLARQVERKVHVFGLHDSKMDATNSFASKGSRSSTFSPTPTYRMGRFNSREIATTIPPLAVPSSFVSTMPV